VTPFYIAGSLLAGWALIVTAIGLRSHSFPGKRGTERAVMAISLVLMLAAAGTGIVGAASEEESEAGEHSEAAAGEGGEGATAAGAPEGPPPGEQEAAGAPGGGELNIKADPSGATRFDVEELSAEAGLVEIRMENPSPLPHNVAIEGDGVDGQGEVVGEGETSFVRTELEPGTYTYYCSVEGHREGGMEGTLTVR
jgi:plastocyanin